MDREPEDVEYREEDYRDATNDLPKKETSSSSSSQGDEQEKDDYLMEEELNYGNATLPLFKRRQPPEEPRPHTGQAKVATGAEEARPLTGQAKVARRAANSRPATRGVLQMCVNKRPLLLKKEESFGSMMALRDPSTRRIDFAGKSVFKSQNDGFNDS